MATANGFSNDVSVLLNTGSGKFAQTTLAAGLGANGINAADLNNDGLLDLAVANYSEGTVSIYVGRASGEFAAPVFYSLGSDPAFLVVGDFDEDGDVDLAGSNISPGNVHILLNRGDGTFAAGDQLAAGAEA